MLTVIVVVCGVWAIGCIALVYMILRAGALCDDEARRPADGVPAATNPRPTPVIERHAEAVKQPDPEEDACASV